jgi:CBS domain-containing protein
MSKRFLTFLPDMDVLEAVGQILDRHATSGFVVDKLGNLVGVLSEVDGLRAGLHGAYHGSGGGHVADIMNTQIKTVDVDDSIMHVARMFVEDREYYRRGFPVMKHNRIVGRITVRDVLLALQEMSRENRAS